MSSKRKTGEPPRHVIVRSREGGLPYSKGLMANQIMTCGLSPVRAFAVAQVIEDRLRESQRGAIEAGELRKLSVDVLRTEAGDRYAEAFQKWQTVLGLDVPLIILIGGGTGVGKSTIATQLAARLGIVRVISTDAIREVMKGVFSQEFMPTLYRSSFDAADVVGAKSPRADDALLVGFRDQVSAVSVGVKALMERAVLEGTDMVIEGAHLVPGFVKAEEAARGAVVVPLVIQVEDEELHRSHLVVRAHGARSRPVGRYLAHFTEIRKIQKYIKSLALQNGVPIVSNHSLDATLASVIELVIDRAVEAAKVRPQRRVRALRGGTR